MKIDAATQQAPILINAEINEYFLLKSINSGLEELYSPKQLLLGCKD